MKRIVHTWKNAAWGAFVLIALAAFQASATEDGTRLNAEQVRSTFIDRDWSQGTGTFLFSSDGTYRYADTRMQAQGTYEIADDGVLCTTNTSSNPGLRTCYTFYHHGDGYRYWHDRSGRYWPAYLR